MIYDYVVLVVFRTYTFYTRARNRPSSALKLPDFFFNFLKKQLFLQKNNTLKKYNIGEMLYRKELVPPEV